MDKQGIVALVCNEETEEADDEDKADQLEVNRCPFSHAEAMNRIDDLLTYYRFQLDATASTVSLLVQLCQTAAEKRESVRKQTSIRSFFSK